LVNGQVRFERRLYWNSQTGTRLGEKGASSKPLRGTLRPLKSGHGFD
jgi:hypothetical protein